jgi:hypothetical protein
MVYKFSEDILSSTEEEKEKNDVQFLARFKLLWFTMQHFVDV